MIYQQCGWVKRVFDRWRNRAARSRLAPVVEVARMISRKLDNVTTYCRHPIASAVIYFACGFLQLDPCTFWMDLDLRRI